MYVMCGVSDVESQVFSGIGGVFGVVAWGKK